MSNVMPKIELTKDHDSLTLLELSESGFGLALRCRHCGSLNLLDIAYLIAAHGSQTRLGYVRRHAQCETCGEPKEA